MSNSKLTQLSRVLRKNATPQEKKLWYQFLNKFPIRFHRQKVILNYIVDFYCHQAKLAIEVDGGQHYEDKNILSDQFRTEKLAELGIKVLRITNREIDFQFRDVCQEITDLVEERIGRSVY